ncbi:MAG: hypothetical protein U0228_08660 [Myxococcaceae bacterium]
MPVELSLKVDAQRLVSVWKNTGSTPVALAFWWNRRLRVRDASGAVVEPGPGPVLPCGVAEDWTVIEPGQSFERDEALACTQPAGRSEPIGWSYDHLAAGPWKVTLLFAAPPAHGFSQSPPHPHAFTGSLESNEVTWVVPTRPKSLMDRLLGR